MNQLNTFLPYTYRSSASDSHTIMATLEAWGEVGQKYKIHEETLAFFRQQKERGARPYQELTVEEAREANRQTSLFYAGDTEFNGSIKEFIVPSIHCPEGVAVSVYKDSICPLTAPVLVYFHGGGMVVGSRQAYDVTCKLIARDTPCIVVNTEYRLAPEHRFPEQFQDVECVTRWVCMNKALIGASSSSRVGVGGDSAGGNLAASVCHHVNVDFQVLVYPMTDHTCSQPSFSEFATTPGLNQGMIQWFQDLHFSSPEQVTDPRYSPFTTQGLQSPATGNICDCRTGPSKRLRIRLSGEIIVCWRHN
ncbi:esterase LipI-like isoform X1 [Haliotis rubra]|uniref:esterase LipI-like isoform X1 n=1 Tax=Haliotis rubra TaxID=36100 RepID=UPI001EE5C40C|nr:esterase LipI-like isoform X1 [Haliotis rubra]